MTVEAKKYLPKLLSKFNLKKVYLIGHSDGATIAAINSTLENNSYKILGTITSGAIGDSYLQLGAVSDALEYYIKAYERRDNNLTSPIYLMKAALCHEIEENYDRDLITNVFTDIASYEWIVFTSSNGVDLFFDLLDKLYL